MNDNVKDNDQAANKEAAGPEFSIQRLYLKDLSLETPNSPAIFLEQWTPEVAMDIGTKTQVLEGDNHEVELTVTVTVKVAEKVAFIVEAKQAGIFLISRFAEDQVAPMLGSFCPNVLYPYVREVITSAVMKAGFPQLYLSPVNFDALYEQHKQKAAEKDKA